MLNQELINTAEEKLPDVTHFARTTHGVQTTFVTLMAGDHNVKYADKIDVYFKAIDRNSTTAGAPADYYWRYITSKVRTMAEGYDPIKYKVETLHIPLKFRGIKISPAAQRLLTEYDINFQEVDGTGPRGKILKKDVVQYIEEELEIKLDEKVTASKSKKVK